MTRFASGGTAIRRIPILLAGLSLSVSFVVFSFPAAEAQAFPQNQKSAWDISPWIGWETGEETTNSFAQARIWSGGILLGRVITGEAGKGWLRGNLEYGFNLVPVFVQSRPEIIHGVAFDPLTLRWNSSYHTRRLAPYIELAGGGVVTTVNLPPGNTSNFNFSAKGGGGIYVLTGKRQALDIACRWSHISNANLGLQNPEFNGVQVSVGYHWYK